MKAFIAVVLLGCLLLASPFAHAADDEKVDEKDVVVLTDKNFKNTLKKHKYALVRPFLAGLLHKEAGIYL